MSTQGSFDPSRKKTDAQRSKEREDERTEGLFKELTGETLLLLSLVGQLAQLLDLASQSGSDTQETGELSQLLSSMMTSSLLSIYELQRELTNTFKPSSKTTETAKVRDMFDGMGHFDPSGEYHHD